MREIKFRVWDKKKRTWFEPDMVRIYGDGSMDFLGRWESISTSPEYELMQYTGLKDKNGKEIYEGDLLGPLFPYFEVGFVNGSFVGTFTGAINRHTRMLYELLTDDLEVIGNIYESRELLEEKK